MISTVLPIEDRLRQAGGVLGPLYGQEAVLHFGDPTAEYEALKQSAGLVWLGHSTQIELTCGERADFLNRLCTSAVDRLAPGDAREAFVTDATGHILAHVLVLVRRDSLVLRTVAGLGGKLVAHLDFYLIQDDVQLHDRSLEWAELLLAGPQAAGNLGGIVGAEPPPAGRAHADAEWRGAALSLRRLDLAMPVYLVSMESAAAGDLWQALCDAGARPCGHQAWEAARLEAGWPLDRVDIDEKNLPQEVGRDRQAISFDKGCYLGQEIVARIDSRGKVNRVLSRLRFESSEIAPPGMELTAEGRPAGHVTSAAFSPDLGSAVALGYLRRGQESAGTRLDSPLGPVKVV